jgi:hypothetical protein
MPLTPTQLHILQHALGVDQYGQGQQYRSHFVTGPGSKDYDDCEALVTAGMMTVRRDYMGKGMLGNHCYHVTQKGSTAVAMESPPPPKIPKARRRYLAWANLDLGISFREFLTHPDFKDLRERC